MRLAGDMRVRLLGTGSSDGWPNPWCTCASCRAAVAEGVLRGQSSALVDDRLLLEIGPEAPRAALRQGVDLVGVEAVLVTHAHPDHHAAPAWMWRGWVPGASPLTLLAPPAVVEAARPHLDASVTAVTIGAGERRSVAGYDVVALPATHAGPEAGPALLYDVTGPDGARLLWAGRCAEVRSSSTASYARPLVRSSACSDSTPVSVAHSNRVPSGPVTS